MDSDRVYVVVGRRSGKTIMQAKIIEELTKAGKTVVPIEPKRTTQIKGFTYAGAIVDLDILDPERMARAEQMMNMILKKSGDS